MKKKVKVVLDTGSKQNLISPKLSAKLNLEFYQNKEVVSLTTANGSELNSDKHAKALIKFTENSHCFYKADILIAENVPEYVLLGENFLNMHNVIINYKEYTVTIDGKTSLSEQNLSTKSQTLRGISLTELVFSPLNQKYLKKSKN